MTSHTITKPKSGYRGVTWNTAKGEWMVCVYVPARNGSPKKSHTVGYYRSPHAAARAYNYHAQRLLGSDANTEPGARGITIRQNVQLCPIYTKQGVRRMNAQEKRIIRDMEFFAENNAGINAPFIQTEQNDIAHEVLGHLRRSRAITAARFRELRKAWRASAGTCEIDHKKKPGAYVLGDIMVRRNAVRQAKEKHK